jgi:hypothetical protein
MIRMLGAIVDASKRAVQLVGTFEARLAEARDRAKRLPERPKVFFEEWDDPLITAIGWGLGTRRNRRRRRHLRRSSSPRVGQQSRTKNPPQLAASNPRFPAIRWADEVVEIGGGVNTFGDRPVHASASTPPPTDRPTWPRRTPIPGN